MIALKLVDVIVSPVCQIESAFLYLRMEKYHGCSQEQSPQRRFFWAPRTNVKMDGFESFSNNIHII